LAAAAQPQENKVGFWSVGDGRECRALVHGRSPQPRPPAVSPDGRMVAANFAEGLILFDLATGRELAAVPFRTAGVLGRIGSFQFEPSGGLLTNSMDGCFRWPVREDPSAPGRLTLGPPERLPFYPSIVSVSTSHDERILAQAIFNGYGMQQHAGGWIVHPDSPSEPVRVMAGSADATTVSPDGRRVAFGGHGNWVRVFDTATCRQVWAMAGGFRCLFAQDGRWLATDTDGNRVYAADTWAPGPQLGPANLACISPDSRLVVLATPAGSFRLVEIETGREVARFDDPDHYADRAAFTPDGTRLVALMRDGLRVWDLRAIRRELTALDLDWDAPPFPSSSPPAEPVLRITVVGGLPMVPAEKDD
jgi:WD40 repeat protein